MLTDYLEGEPPAQASVQRILEAQQACIAAGPHRTGMFFAPVIDGDALPLRPLDAIARGDARAVEILIGTTETEMQLYATIPGLGEFPDEILTKVVASRLAGDEAQREAHAARAVSLYRDELQSPSQRDLFFALETDLSLRVPSTQLAESQADFQPNTYMYLFQWRSPMSDGHGGTLGACHALDLPFTFGALENKAARAFATGDRDALSAKARILSGNLMDSWIAFARRGDPSHPGIGTWPRYDRTDRTTMLLGPDCHAENAPLEARRAVWEK
jgi:para-nitrobenzyl esterase